MKQTTGKTIAVKKQWWLKINTKPLRLHPLDGAVFPHIIKVSFSVDGKEYVTRKWISAGGHVPTVGSDVKVSYDENKPSKATILL